MIRINLKLTDVLIDGFSNSLDRSEIHPWKLSSEFNGFLYLLIYMVLAPPMSFGPNRFTGCNLLINCYLPSTR